MESMIKSFTHPKATSYTGTGMFRATSCKAFPIKNLSNDLQGRVLALFNVDSKEDEDADETVGLVVSQDFPQHKQSQGNETLKICRSCKFKTRDQEDFDNHNLLHPKCGTCGTQFGDDEMLRRHVRQYHETFVCDKCDKEVLEAERDKHIAMHETRKVYKSALKLGKVKAKNNQQKRKVYGDWISTVLFTEEICNDNVNTPETIAVAETVGEDYVEITTDAEPIDSDTTLNDVQEENEDVRVIFIRDKTMYWPARILKRTLMTVTAEIFDKKKVVTKKMTETKTFSSNPMYAKGKSHVWVKAFKMAVVYRDN